MLNSESVILLGIILAVLKSVDYLMRRKESKDILEKVETMFNKLSDKAIEQNKELLETSYEIKYIKENQNKMVEGLAQISKSQMQLAVSIINMEKFITTKQGGR